jgi:trk system potassium uptake protein TrkH
VGFAVWADVIAYLTAGGRRARLSKVLQAVVGRRDRLSVYTRFVLLISLFLLVLGTILTAVLEWNSALSGMSIGQKWLDSFFHSVSLRTAGFAVFDNSTLSDTGKGISICFMLVGGASGSTAGGLKVSTVAILFYAAWKIAMGNNEIILFRRKISKQLILRAMTLVLIGLFFVCVFAMLLCMTGGFSPLDCLYEAASAYATVGLSSFDNGLLNPFGRMLVILLMFMGRVGILTIIYSFVMKSAQKNALIDYPETTFLIG